MEKNKPSKILSIIALVVAIAGLTIGFASFSSTLTISSSATLKPSSSDFSVLFSTSGKNQTTGSVTGGVFGVAGATAGEATISGTTITGLEVNFTAPGQAVMYTFYAHNVGLYDAYLKKVTYGTVAGTNSFIKCTIPEGSGATQTLVDAACSKINVQTFINASVVPYRGTTGVLTGEILTKGSYSEINVIIEYPSEPVDGDVNVEFGDISLLYSSTDA